MLPASLAVWKQLSHFGFDLVQPFATRDYNDSSAAQEQPFRLPQFAQANAFALVIANTGALWSPFIRAVRQLGELRFCPHPLDVYTERCIKELQLRSEVRSLAFFSHQQYPVVPMQRLAHVAGLAELSPSHLSVHPKVGPWLGLRAVVVFDWPATRASANEHALCGACAKPCLKALQAVTSTGPRTDGSEWRRWLRVRDSCPVGTQARYGQSQIRYHYTKDRTALFE